MDPTDADAVLFDLDGTLVRLDVDWPAFRERLASFLPQEVLCDGPERPATWTLAELRERGEEDRYGRVLEILRSVELGGATRSSTIPVGLSILQRVRDRPLALVTNNTRAAAQEALRRHGLRPSFSVVVALEDVDRHKPHPDGLELALDGLGVGAEDALFVGDGRKDRDAAAQAGIDFIDVDELEDRERVDGGRDAG